MNRLVVTFLSAILTLTVVESNALAQTPQPAADAEKKLQDKCAQMACQKKLSGAAQQEFVSKCVADGKKKRACKAEGKAKKLVGDALTKFVDQCVGKDKAPAAAAAPASGAAAAPATAPAAKTDGTKPK
jgi:hypothetical protein